MQALRGTEPAAERAPTRDRAADQPSKLLRETGLTITGAWAAVAAAARMSRVTRLLGGGILGISLRPGVDPVGGQ